MQARLSTTGKGPRPRRQRAVWRQQTARWQRWWLGGLASLSAFTAFSASRTSLLPAPGLATAPARPRMHRLLSTCSPCHRHVEEGDNKHKCASFSIVFLCSLIIYPDISSQPPPMPDRLSVLLHIRVPPKQVAEVQPLLLSSQSPEVQALFRDHLEGLATLSTRVDAF